MPTLAGYTRAADLLGLVWCSADMDAPCRSDFGVYRIAI